MVTPHAIWSNLRWLFGAALLRDGRRLPEHRYDQRHGKSLHQGVRCEPAIRRRNELAVERIDLLFQEATCTATQPTPSRLIGLITSHPASGSRDRQSEQAPWSATRNALRV